MKRPRVVATRPFPGAAFERLAERCDLWVGPAAGTPRALLFEQGREAEGLLCTLDDRVDAELLAGLPRLRIVATPAAGTDHLDLAAARARGLWVCHAPDATTESTADLAWALILGVARRIGEGDRLVRQGLFTGWSPSLLLGLELRGATLGVVGAGKIGQAVLRRARGFGLRLLYARPGGPLPALAAELGASFLPLEGLLAESDVVSLHVPLGPGTRHLIDGPALGRMKPGAILINTARGPIVDEAALVEALEAGRLSGVGLDVFEREPKVHPGLLRNDRALLLPHLGSATLAARARMADVATRAVAAVLLEGREPEEALVRP